MAKSGETIHTQRTPEIDPDPIAILTICIATIGMLSSVTSTISQLVESRRQRREARRALVEPVADFVVAAEHILSTGRHLNDVITNLERDASVARSFLLPSSERNLHNDSVFRQLLFVMGINSVILQDRWPTPAFSGWVPAFLSPPPTKSQAYRR